LFVWPGAGLGLNPKTPSTPSTKLRIGCSGAAAGAGSTLVTATLTVGRWGGTATAATNVVAANVVATGAGGENAATLDSGVESTSVPIALAERRCSAGCSIVCSELVT
jgi:hypothetical protein